MKMRMKIRIKARMCSGVFTALLTAVMYLITPTIAVAQSSAQASTHSTTAKNQVLKTTGRIVGLSGQIGTIRFINEKGKIVTVTFDSHGTFRTPNTHQSWYAWSVQTDRAQYGMAYSYVDHGVLVVKLGPDCKVVGSKGVNGEVLVNDRGTETQANLRSNGTVDYQIYPWVQIENVTLSNNQTFSKGQFSITNQQGVYSIAISPASVKSTEVSKLAVGDGFVVSSFTSKDGAITVSGDNPNIHFLWFYIVHEGSRKEADSVHGYSVDGKFSVSVPLRYGTGKYSIQMFESGDTIAEMYGIPLADKSFTGTTVNFEVTNEYPTNPLLMPSETIPSDAPQIVALAKQITAGATKDYDKAKAIYDWVTHNISYDDNNNRLNQWCEEHHLSGLGENQALLIYEVLDTRAAQCGGYAVLTAALNRAAGIQTAQAVGPADGIYHAWDYVTIDGRSFNEDTCWGAADSHGNFDPDPAVFAKSHTLLQISD